MKAIAYPTFGELFYSVDIGPVHAARDTTDRALLGLRYRIRVRVDRRPRGHDQLVARRLAGQHVDVHERVPTVHYFTRFGAHRLDLV